MNRRPRPEPVDPWMEMKSEPRFDPLVGLAYVPEFWVMNQKLPAHQKLLLVLVGHLGFRSDMRELCGMTEDEFSAAMRGLIDGGHFEMLQAAWDHHGSAPLKAPLPASLNGNLIRIREAA